jgi:hypothetical protein
MRYYLIVEDGGRPFVMAESPDHTYAVDDLRGEFGGCIVREDEKFEDPLTPERAEAIRAWKAGDDSAYVEWAIRRSTEATLAEAAGNY